MEIMSQFCFHYLYMTTVHDYFSSWLLQFFRSTFNVHLYCESHLSYARSSTWTFITNWRTPCPHRRRTPCCHQCHQPNNPCWHWMQVPPCPPNLLRRSSLSTMTHWREWSINQPKKNFSKYFILFFWMAPNGLVVFSCCSNFFCWWVMRHSKILAIFISINSVANTFS